MGWGGRLTRLLGLLALRGDGSHDVAGGSLRRPGAPRAACEQHHACSDIFLRRDPRWAHSEPLHQGPSSRLGPQAATCSASHRRSERWPRHGAVQPRQDTDSVDNLLPQTINQLLGTVFLCIFTLATMAFITPWLTVVIGVVRTRARPARLHRAPASRLTRRDVGRALPCHRGPRRIQSSCTGSACSTTGARRASCSDWTRSRARPSTTTSRKR